jgi:hypothetical protein
MLLRISLSPGFSLSSPRCLCQQTRTYKNQLFRKPQVFYQNIVLTDGSSFKVMTVSPRKTHRLTRDKYNNPLWTGRRRSAEEDEQNQQLAKFRKSFSGAIGGEESMKQLREDRRRKQGANAIDPDEKIASADALFSMLESKDAYVPTRGREGMEKLESTGKTKGGRTA